MRAKPVLITVGVTAAVFAGVFAYAVTRIEPADVVRLAAERVKSQTGREFAVDGTIGYSISLEPTVSLEGVRFRNATWGTRPDMLLVKRVDIGIALLPLLRGRIDIRGLTLIEPDVLLEANAQGAGNWSFQRDDATAASSTQAATPLPIDIRHAAIERGVLTYRSAKDGSERRFELTTLAARTSGARTTLTASARHNAETIDLDATLDRGHAPANIVLTLKSSGATLTAKGTVPDPSATDAGTAVQFKVDIADWGTVARLAGTDPITLPALQAGGRLGAAANAWTIDGLEARLGRSVLAGSVRIDRTASGPTFDLKLDAPLMDLAELQGRPGKKASNDGRIFSADPLPVAALAAIDGRLDARIARLALRDGKTVDGVELKAVAAKGRVSADPVRLRIGGKDLHMRATLDAASGKTLGIEMTADGSGIPLGALGALMNVTGTPEGSPTDLAVRFSGRGDSMRTLMAGANADVRIVVGPGRLRNRAIDWGADVTELLNAINPARRSEPYTDLKCAVVRLPIRQGVARIDNGIAAETGKVSLIAAGVIDFRNEILDLGFRPKAATGLGIGLGGLASLGRLRGPLAAPKVELDMSGTATAAAQLGLAAATGGMSLLAGGLLLDSVPDNACQAALTGTAARSAPRSGTRAPAVVDELVGGIKKLFGR